ncbi:LysR family transcriptional regulator [Oceanicola sp. D3]|uniref:LysR family transcriptional regulator n=1 Tax=Oceanicola sp. D3 TaxID=2587163 RepID=UPI00111D7585|nr:LysR family transcriptional regulator [Oceanicola sp. D3]QDC10075.1 LysR family transcriptional regulator [Oceanicola sp. D3]
MDDLDIMGLDLKALGLLCKIHEARSLTLAAERAGIAQSTASYTLERLRRAFGDSLFHRAARGVVPTVRCDAIVAALRPALDDLRELGSEDSFDMARETTPYTIAGNFYERSLLLPPLLARLRAAAPHMPVAMVPASSAPHRMLQDGQCDVAISPVAPGAHKLRVERLFREHYTCFVDPASAIATEGLTLERFATGQHLTIAYSEGWRPFWQDEMLRLGVRLTPAVTVPSFGGVERILAGSDLILTAPSGLARLFTPALTAVPTPFACSFDVNMMWTPRTDNSARHRRIREMIRAVANDPPRPMPGPDAG